MTKSSIKIVGNKYIISKGNETYIFEQKHLNVEGVDAVYTEIGTGEKIILELGGFPAPWCICWEMDAILSKHFKIIILELPGYLGTNGNPDFIHTYQNFSNFIYSFISVSRIHPNYIFGESYGGKVVLELVKNHPDLFEKIILHSPGYAKPKIPFLVKLITYGLYPLLKIKPTYKFINAILISIFLKIGTKYVMEGYKLQNIDKLTKAMLIDSVKSAQMLPLCEIMIDVMRPLDVRNLNKVTQQTLVISGNDDESVNIADSINLARNILINGEFIGVPNVGHWLPVLKPEITSRIIIDSLKSEN